jgi:hypothetical protein
MRRATLVICAINAAYLFFLWTRLGGSDPAGNALEEAWLVLTALFFAATSVPAVILALRGRLPRIALALALISSVLCLLANGL